MRWRTRVINSEEAAKLDARIVRLEIFEKANPTNMTQLPLAYVDVLVNAPEKKKDQQ